ncbi:MAG: hypothetical protein GWN67_18050 [Phycisphaerae bacterium]|nr:hypothetical protein [Phycisphaerae bacterium]NIP54717.1 hypothetical protein [Phycisphaerae bacterium]NIS51839.1 hypothetical protein [Phycisphaerae bacterium]NIU10459.1 hypothetical protein [Phycisphaerae bacterium]NIU58214.1 hypothetical protein [Phycisphaerae bacterium]
MSIQLPYVIFLMLTPIKWWKVALHPLIIAFAGEASLTAFAGIFLVISVILLGRLIARHGHFEDHLRREIANLTTINMELRHKIDRLYQEQVEVLEEIIDAKPPEKDVPGFNPQEMKALSELAKRLS